MSVLIRDPNDDRIKLLVKGADSVIRSRLAEGSMTPELEKKTDWFLEKASKKGLRTLLMAMKIVEEDEM